MNDLQSIELRLQRIEAYQQIQNVMGRYAYYHTANMHQECMELFALDTPGVRAEMMWGVYEGRESLERLYPGFHHWVDGDGVGKMHVHALTTPVIEVSADGTKAKAVWLSPGHETMSFTPGAENEAAWAWMKYGCDFVIENGEWKIWHLHCFGIFMAPYSLGWVKGAMEEMPAPDMPNEYLPDKPPTSGWTYHPSKIYPKNEPVIPGPIATWEIDAEF